MSKQYTIRMLKPTAFLLLAALAASTLWAGGPLPPPIAPGVFGRWNPAEPVRIILDNGPLSATITRDQAAEAIREILGIWEDVPTSTISFSDQGFLGVDVTAEFGPGYVFNFLNKLTPEGNPIIFDADGSIIDAVLGEGASNSVLGFARPFFIPGGTDDGFYDAASAVLNGLRANLTSNSVFRRAALHEVGHLIGLDHTQAGQEFFNALQFGNVPIMFPFIGPGPSLLRQDDISWISWIYPTPDFATQTASISGIIRRRSMGAFGGANVVAVPLNPAPAGGPVEGNQHVSAVSDFLVEGNGQFVLPGLPPGDYAVFIEPLNGAFTMGSGVGPYELRFTGFPKDYFNGVSEAGENPPDDPTQSMVLTLAAGQELSGINLISNETANQLDSLGDDDEEPFSFPPGFSFPFFGVSYDSLVVNSDGNLTFTAGDNPSTDRDEDRFLGGPPRIAPLFTDLDPSAGGEVVSTFENGHLTFSWVDVPEYNEFGGRPGNDFSVTLFPTGDILFRYGTISVIPDDGLQAIVGLSPGGRGGGTQVNFSQMPNPIVTSNDPIYETFRSGGLFDLNNRNLFFDASSGQFFYLYPFLEGDFSTFTGFSISNDSDETALLDIQALKAEGSYHNYPQNPGFEVLESKKQIARLATDFFNLPVNAVQEGWVRIAANTDRLASFFLFGDGLADLQSRLDGSVAITEQGTPLYFTRIFEGDGAFPLVDGTRNGETTFYVANPNADPITVTFTLFDSAGAPVGDPVERPIAGNGCLKERAGDLFGTQQLVGGLVRVDVNGPGAVGFELIRLGDTLIGFNAVSGNSEVTGYSGQLASGSLAQGESIFTSIKLSNVSASAREVTLTATADDGSELASQMVTLQPNQSLETTAADLFDLGDVAVDPAVAGSLTVVADGDGIIGNVIFGDPFLLRYAAALPLQSQLLTRAVFSQVANQINLEDPSRQTFTGLAFFNPNGETVDITIRVFMQGGELTGETTIQLAAGTRSSTLLAALVPESAGQIRGYVEVEASLPVVGQQLFGNQTLHYLSAVPPTIFQ